MIFEQLQNCSLENYLKAFLEHFVYSAIPPTSLLKILFLVVAGTKVAGLKWHITMKIGELHGYF